MVTDSKNPSESKLKAWCLKWLAGIVFRLIIVSMIVWIGCLVLSDRPDKPSWLLLPITVIYAMFTLGMAGAAFQNATAARRSAEAMEASVVEQRQSRWAAFAAIVSFPEGQTCRVNTDGSTSIVLGNPYRQPMLQLCVRLWQMEGQGTGEGQIKYSTMMESIPMEVAADASHVTVQLQQTSQPESERIRIADLALQRFRHIFQNAVPKSALCLITYLHRAQIGETVLVYDLQRADVQS
ncbi:MAG: hypothetical protein JXQ75_08180 [Phycisphaerae bacterium]|nr:hypothetical protein [Phycisphaerae bacterium]